MICSSCRPPTWATSACSMPTSSSHPVVPRRPGPQTSRSPVRLPVEPSHVLRLGRPRWASDRSRDPTVEITRPRVTPGQPARPIVTQRPESRPSIWPTRSTAVDPGRGRLHAGMRCCEIAVMSRGRSAHPVSWPNLIAVHGKGGQAAERMIPVHPGAGRRPRERHGMPRTGPVLRRPDGRPMPAWLVSQTANEYLHGLGIDATAHRSCATGSAPAPCTRRRTMISCSWSPGWMGHASGDDPPPRYTPTGTAKPAPTRPSPPSLSKGAPEG